MNRLLCWLTNHDFDSSRKCTRCGEYHTLLLLIDALAPTLAQINALMAAQTVKPEIEHVRQLSEEEQMMMQLGRNMPNMRSQLPRHIQDMLSQEDQEWTETK